MKRAPITPVLCSWLAALLGCASSGSDAPDAASTIDASTAPRPDASGAPDAGDGTVAACPSGQFATAVTTAGELVCAAATPATAEAVRARCSVYLGHRDSCDGCTDAPAKWSVTNPLACSAGAGAGNACVAATLDDPATPVSLATVDLVGDVNDDDKFYSTLHCVLAPRDPRPAPCAPGWAISGRNGETWMCSPVSEAAVGYVRSSCAVYLGWRDSCDGCTTAPAKWGFANDAGCTNGAGADNTCTTATLGTESVNLFGLNSDGDIDGNDKLYLGLACAPPDSPTSTATTACPAGQFVVATAVDGSFTCADGATVFGAYVHDACSLFFGWRDSCDGCTQPPTKWGSVTAGGCALGVGADDTCADATLGDVTLPMFGLNTDGDVNSDDTLYVGLRCNP